MRSATKNRLWLYGLLLLVLSSANPVPARAGTLSPDLQRLVSANPLSLEPVRVVVQYSQTGVLGDLLAFLYHGTFLGDLELIDGALMLVPQALLPALSLDESVSSVSADLPVVGLLDQDTQASGATQVWAASGLRGTGVRVAVIDSGVNPDTTEWNAGSGASRVVAFKDLVDNRSTPYDDNGHGTHVSGIVLGGGSHSGGVITGTAPGADLVSVKVLRQDGSGFTSTVIQGINWCVKNRTALNLKVINLSLGHRATESYRTDPLCKAVRKAVRAGLVVVCSAGNSGKDGSGNVQYGGINSPGIEPSAITVGALNTFRTASRYDDTVCTYSSRGPTMVDGLPKPDLLAPGNRIVSVRTPGSYLDLLYPGNRVHYDPNAAAEYYELSGTSMAAPQVAGIAALMLEANPGLSPNAVKGVLMYTAQRLSLTDGNGAPLASVHSVLTQGAGSVNAVGAVEVAILLNTNASVGTTWATGPFSYQSTVAESSFEWSRLVLWNKRWVQGTALLQVRQPLWTNGRDWQGEVEWSDGVSALEYTEPEEPPPPDDDTQITWSDSGPIRGD